MLSCMPAIPIKRILLIAAGLLIPGSNLILMGRYRRALLLWAAIFTAFFLFWFGECLAGGSTILCWIYVVTLALLYLSGAFQRPSGALVDLRSGLWKKLLAACLVLLPLWGLSAAGLGIQYGAVSASMEPSIAVGDNVLADPFSYKLGRPIARGDIAAHRKPDGGQTLFLHRVIGLPGDSIEIKQGFLSVNGKRQDDPRYRRDTIEIRRRAANAERVLAFCDRGNVPKEYCDISRIDLGLYRDSLGWRLAPDRYFLLGDNYYNSADSRYYGSVGRSDIRARIICYGIGRLFSHKPFWKNMGRPIR